MPWPTAAPAGLPPFAPEQAGQLVAAVADSEPLDHGLPGHGLPGHGWTLKKLRRWALARLGIAASRGSIRRVLHASKLSWKEVKKLLGKAQASRRAGHIARLEGC